MTPKFIKLTDPNSDEYILFNLLHITHIRTIDKGHDGYSVCITITEANFKNEYEVKETLDEILAKLSWVIL